MSGVSFLAKSAVSAESTKLAAEQYKKDFGEALARVKSDVNSAFVASVDGFFVSPSKDAQRAVSAIKKRTIPSLQKGFIDDSMETLRKLAESAKFALEQTGPRPSTVENPGGGPHRNISDHNSAKDKWSKVQQQIQDLQGILKNAPVAETMAEHARS